MPWATVSDSPGTPSKLSCQTSPATGVPLRPSVQASSAGPNVAVAVPSASAPFTAPFMIVSEVTLSAPPI
jgi:hypothetical protein